MNPEAKKTTYQIHVSSYQLQQNHYDRHRNGYVCAIRRKDDEDGTVVLARGALIHGASKMVHQQNDPLPGSRGRAVVWMETDSDVSIQLDESDPNRAKFDLGGTYLKLDDATFDKLKEVYLPPSGC